MKILTVTAIILFTLTSQSHAKDKDIKKEMIEQSILFYHGSCACPYSKDRAGRSCGKRSAYNKPRGYTPICYEHDITEEMIKLYIREQNKG